jgi:hypothetical protein
LRLLIGLLLIGLAFFAASSNRPKDRLYDGSAIASRLGITEQDYLAYTSDPLEPFPRTGHPEWVKYRLMKTVEPTKE